MRSVEEEKHIFISTLPGFDLGLCNNRQISKRKTSRNLSVYFLYIIHWRNIGLCNSRVGKSLGLYNIFSSVQFNCSAMSDSLWPHGLQHARLPCPSPTPRAFSNSCSLSQWCHPTISSSVVPFSSVVHHSASGSFHISQFLALGGQSIRVSASASVLLVNIQDWFPIGWSVWISLLCKELSRVLSNTTVQKHQFFGFFYSPTLMYKHDYWKNQNWLGGPLLAKWGLCFLIWCLGCFSQGANVF